MTLARKNAQLAQTINVSGTAVGDTLFIPSSGLVDVSGSLNVNNIPVSVSGHNHIVDDILNFTSGVSGIVEDVVDVVVVGSGGVAINYIDDQYVLSVSGDLSANSGSFNSLNISGIPVSISGHSHVSNDIIDFNPSVSGLLPTITNSGDNRVLTSTGTNVGINAETNLTFDGSLLSISGNLVANSGSFDVVKFNPESEFDLLIGEIGWDNKEGTVSIAVSNDTDVHIGQHNFFRVRNTTSNILHKGQAVYASGVHSNGLIVPNLYSADGNIREIRFIGLILENINNNNNGYVVNFGHIEDIDTRGNVATDYSVGDETWAAGDILYVHPSIPGKLTKNEPKHSISAAIVLSAAINGRVFVRPTSYGHLDDNHDVAVSGATNGQFLQYNSVTDYWVPSSSGNFNILQVSGVSVPTGTGTSNYITKWNNSNSIGNGIIYDNGTSIGIGTTSPARNIDVVSSAGTSVGIKLNSTGAGGRSFSFFSTNNGSSLGGGRFGMYDDTAQASRFVIDSIGNIGIGTNSPAYKLDIVGTGNFSQNLLVNGVPVSISGHTHSSSNITDFNSSVSGLLPLTGLVGSQYISVVNTNRNFTISATGLQPSGNYSLVDHSHLLNDITDAGSLASQNSDNVNISGGTINNFNVSNYSPTLDNITITKNNIKKYNYFIDLQTSGNVGIYNLLAEDGSEILTENNDIITTEYYGSQKLFVPSGALWQYNLTLNVFDNNSEDSASFNMRGCVKYNNSGISFVGSQIKESYKDSTMSSVDLNVYTNTDSLDIQPNSPSGSILSWGGVLNIVEFTK